MLPRAMENICAFTFLGILAIMFIDKKCRKEEFMDIIPFKNVAGLMLIQGRADCVKGLFALDTGAMQTSLNKNYFPVFEGTHAEVAVFDKSMSDAAAAEIMLREFTVGSLTAHGLPAMLIDMSYVENSLRTVDPDVCFYGSIGINFLEIPGFCLITGILK